MNKFKILTHTGLFLVLIAAITFFAVNGFNYSDKSTKQLTKNDEKFSQVRIFVTNEQDESRMVNAGLLIDHAIRKPGQFIDAWLSEKEMQMLQNSGVPYQVLIDDWDTYYNSINIPMTQEEMDGAMRESEERYNVSHSIYGTMGGHLKFAEAIAKIDSMRIQYPTLISQKFSIGTTYEGRTIWAVRITKNPDAPTGRPQVLYHAVIHAREPVSMSSQMYYFYWLFENYNIDPMATYILNNREIYWIPYYNPDGHVHNETTNPNGGGNWRCNKHLTSPPSLSCGPVDLNRNYGIYAYWNSTNGGSSTNSCSGGSGTYRGTSPFSELETQAMFNFVNSHQFKSGLGAHTYGNYLIRPFAWNNTPTPDDNIFQEYSIDMTQYNHYTYGRAYQTVGYHVRGGADDWYYNDSGHTKMIEMTPETGASFWPTQAQIMPLVEGMLWTNQYIALIAGAYVYPLSKTFNQPNYNPGQSGTYKVKFRNKGLTTANNVKVQLIPWNSFVTIPTQQYTFASVPTFASDSATFNFTLAGNAPVNCAIPTTLNLKIDTSTVYTETVYIYVGAGAITLNDNAETGIGNWTPTGGWAWKTDYSHSPTHSFGYAPYVNSANYSLTLTNPINMQSVPVCYLSFWNRYNTESGWDFCLVELSTNNGSTWTQISSYTGSGLTWTEQSFDITHYVNSSSQFKIRFRLTADDNTIPSGSGWWVDDIKFTNYCLGLVGVPGNTNIPKTFALEQNYPNPFNPVTSIKYQLPSPENVSIKIFDILGKEVATLVNETKEPGYYEVNYDASNLASGLYFYRIEAGSFTQTKKMMLIK